MLEDGFLSCREEGAEKEWQWEEAEHGIVSLLIPHEGISPFMERFGHFFHARSQI